MIAVVEYTKFGKEKNMGIKLHQVPPTYNATPRRVTLLARHITQHLKATQATHSARNSHYILNEKDVIRALESFIAPKAKG